MLYVSISANNSQHSRVRVCELFASQFGYVSNTMISLNDHAILYLIEHISHSNDIITHRYVIVSTLKLVQTNYSITCL